MYEQEGLAPILLPEDKEPPPLLARLHPQEAAVVGQVPGAGPRCVSVAARQQPGTGSDTLSTGMRPEPPAACRETDRHVGGTGLGQLSPMSTGKWGSRDGSGQDSASRGQKELLAPRLAP